ncbi:MAG TPA: hypothetical protein VMF90_16335 [Rhizobiaceae bacterium]|nr:hypothetical protein [Rhizobiaceae bacterium]
MAELSLALFAAFSVVRVLAYFPQMASILRDTNGAAAVSCWSWGLFAASHLATAAHVVLSMGAWSMAIVFVVNAVLCTTIVVLTLTKRIRYRR